LIYHEDGKWFIVDDATIDGDYLVFTAEVPRAYAVVVDVDNSVVDVPVTGDIVPWVLMSVMLVSAIGIVLVIVSYKKRSEI